MARQTTRWTLIALLATGFAAGTALQAWAAAPAHEHPTPAPAQGRAAPAAGPRQPMAVGRENVVANEMRALTAAMNTALAAIANDDLAAIPPALHAVHAAREQTERAIHAGTYQPPKNGGQLERFVAMDEAFHDELVVLLRAARAGDSAAAARQVGTIMNGCVSCHQQFRR